VSESVACCSENKFICSDDIWKLGSYEAARTVWGGGELYGVVRMKHTSPIEIHQQLLKVIGDSIVRVQHVRICCRELKYG
jgi:hypothetical protein